MYFCAIPRNTENRNFKNDVIHGYKATRLSKNINLKFGMPDVQERFYMQHIIRFFENFENFVLCKKLYKNFSFFTFWVKNISF